jgi:lipoprotein-anchoring transpeptidase ErfK/SrfK
MTAVPMTRAARTAFTIGLLGTATLAAAGSLVLTAGHSTPAGPGSAATSRALAEPPAALARQTASPSPSPLPPAVTSTLLATVRTDAPRYSSPGKLASGTVPASWYERPSVLPVLATKPGWVEVRLAQRPNESTAWLPAGDVTLSRTSYEIMIDLATTTLSLFDDGKLVFSAPAGVGTTDDPTPAGSYFVAFHEQPPSAGYGPFILVTSAHSQAIGDWEGSGDAVVGIHGPLGEDKQIGTTGARISHGCVRLHNQSLEKLTDVPAGTPIEVVR